MTGEPETTALPEDADNLDFVAATELPDRSSLHAEPTAGDEDSAEAPLDSDDAPPEGTTEEPTTAASLSSARANRVLDTQCPALDMLLDGGIETDAITLVFGEAGSGKTNLALQLARSAARDGKRVAYVDTEGVSPTRLEQVFGSEGDAQDRLLFFTPFDIRQQERMVRNATLAPNLGLVVVDSINMHYRLHMDGGDAMLKEANHSLVQQLHHLTTFARKHQVPVLVTGQVYGTEDGTHPFARRTMEHLVKALVRFHKTPDGERKATVLKHRSIPDGAQARFKIGPSGLESSDKE